MCFFAYDASASLSECSSQGILSPVIQEKDNTEAAKALVHPAAGQILKVQLSQCSLQKFATRDVKCHIVRFDFRGGIPWPCSRKGLEGCGVCNILIQWH